MRTFKIRWKKAWGLKGVYFDKKGHDICVFSCQSREGRPDLEMLNAGTNSQHPANLQRWKDGKSSDKCKPCGNRETTNHDEKTILHIYELIIPLTINIQQRNVEKRQQIFTLHHRHHRFQSEVKKSHYRHYRYPAKIIIDCHYYEDH